MRAQDYYWLWWMRRGGGSTFLGTLTPGTSDPRGQPTMHYFKPLYTDSAATQPRKKEGIFTEREGFVSKRRRASIDEESNGLCGFTCHKCGEHFVRWEGLESHHLSKHAY